MYALNIERMTCGGCAARVTKALQALDAEAKVDIDLAGKTVRVASSASLDAITAALAQAGYPARADTAG